MATEVKLSWKVCDNIVTRHISLHEEKVLLSEYFLQNLLPPNCKFLTLNAIVQFGELKSEVEVPSHKDIDDNKHFLLEASLSKEFSIVHSTDVLYVSDSSEDNIKSCDGSSSSELEMFEDLPLGLDTADLSDSKPGQQSILPWLIENTKGNRLKCLLDQCAAPMFVQEVPRVYDGHVIFELPATFGIGSNMDGMQQKYDGHVWSRPRKSNMAVPCNVKLSYCLGYLECQKNCCIYFKNNQKYNDRFFNGHLENQTSKGLLAEEERTKITCQYCKQVVYCVQPCSCSVYYVIPNDKTMTRLVIHLGQHNHPVEPGTSRAAIERLKKLVSTFLTFNKGSGPRKIQMLVARKLLMDSLTMEQNEPVIEGDINNFLEELIPLVQNQR